jgi:hypothetical protein
MLQCLREVWLPRVLFVLTTAAALGLLLAVVLSPLLDEGPYLGNERLDVLGLFAHDAVVRRTAVTSGLGLLVTACVFFRPAPPEESKSDKRPPTPMAGA